MNTRIALFSLLLLVFASCSKDESKLIVGGDSIRTDGATDITATSAVVSGYYNFFGEMNEYLQGTDYTQFNESVVLHRNEVAEFLDLLDIKAEVVIPAGCPDSVVLNLAASDLDFMGAGVCYDSIPQFLTPQYVSSAQTKIKHYSEKLSPLKPNRTYYYKTFIKFRMECSLTCPQIPSIHSNRVDLGDTYDYYVYGETRSFQTLK